MAELEPTTVTNVIEGEIKQRATVEDLLGLSVKGWEDIAKMSDEELAIYLSDITVLEPKSDVENAQLRGGKEVKVLPKTKSKALQELENDDDPENPIKLNKGPKRRNVKKSTESFISADDLEKELGL